jgi:predicted TIM-barrel fold metal-dependent hydrolase
MTYLALDGLFDRFPRVKVVIHHCGALAPFFDARITESYEFSRYFRDEEREELKEAAYRTTKCSIRIRR